MEEITGTAGGVPYVALPPAGGETNAPLIIAWHLHDPPRSEVAMAAALPLRGVAAWRVYLGLPFCGSRLPAGGIDAFQALGYDDAVLKVFEPTCREAVAELPPALAALRAELPLDDGPVGLVGGSVGALVALSVLTEVDLPVAAVGLVSPALQLRSVVAANERRFGVTYPWGDESRVVADRLDFLARADEIRASGAAVLLAVGELDDGPGIRLPAEQLHHELTRSSPDAATLVTIPGMGHAIADEPGLDAAPQNQDAARVDALLTDWFTEHLASTPEIQETES